MQSRGYHLLGECVAVGADPQPHLHIEIHARMHAHDQRQIRGHQRSSEAIRDHERPSEVISGHHLLEEYMQRGHQRSLVATSPARGMHAKGP